MGHRWTCEEAFLILRFGVDPDIYWGDFEKEEQEFYGEEQKMIQKWMDQIYHFVGIRQELNSPMQWIESCKRSELKISEVVLEAFESLTKSSQPEQPLGSRERDTLLRLLIGMAVKGYSYDPEARKSSTPKEIADDLAELGISITDDTVRKFLKMAADNALPAKQRKT